MKLLIINLKRSVDRKVNIEKQLNRLNITNYEFIDAIDANTLKDTDQKHSNRLLKKLLNRSKPLLKTEIACASSHIKAYTRCLELNERCIILEDDVILNDIFNPYEISNEYDLVYYGYTLKDSFSGEKILETHSHKLDTFYRPVSNNIIYNEFYKMEHNLMVYGCYAYSPSLSACNKLIINFHVPIPIDIYANTLGLTQYCSINRSVYANRQIKSTIGDRSER